MLNAEIYQKDAFIKYSDISSNEELIEWALLMLSGGSSSFEYNEDSINDFSIRTFDGAHLFSEYLEDDSKFFQPFCSEINLDLIDQDIKKLNLKLFHIPRQKTSKELLFPYLSRFSYLPFKERRGKSFKAPRILKIRQALLFETEKWYTLQHYARLYNRTFSNFKEKIKKYGIVEADLDKELDVNPDFKFDLLYPVVPGQSYKYNEPDRIGVDMSAKFNMKISIAFTAYYNWHIYLKEEGSKVGFQIPFKFSHLDEIYKLREMPKTKTGRKKAIIHFVKGHHRRLKIKDVQGNEIGEKEIWIKKFLRGESNFKWRGIEVGIIPSKYDLRRVKTTKKFADSRFLD